MAFHQRNLNKTMPSWMQNLLDNHSIDAWSEDPDASECSGKQVITKYQGNSTCGDGKKSSSEGFSPDFETDSQLVERRRTKVIYTQGSSSPDFETDSCVARKKRRVVYNKDRTIFIKAVSLNEDRTLPENVQSPSEGKATLEIKQKRTSVLEQEIHSDEKKVCERQPVRKCKSVVSTGEKVQDENANHKVKNTFDNGEQGANVPKRRSSKDKVEFKVLSSSKRDMRRVEDESQWKAMELLFNDDSLSVLKSPEGKMKSPLCGTFKTPRMSFTPIDSSFNKGSMEGKGSNDKDTCVRVSATQKVSPQKKGGEIESNSITNKANDIATVNLEEDSENFVCDTQMLREIECRESGKTGKFDKANLNTGFVKASGNKIKPPSKGSLEKVRNLFNEEYHRETITSEPQKQMIGFITTSGSKLKPPSNQSLQNVRTLFDEAWSEKVTSDMPPKNTGFMTASGSKLTPPSKQSLQKSRNLFDEDMREGIRKPETAQENVGSMTTGNKFKPSKEPFQEARNLFNVDMPGGISEIEMPKANFGFTTASGSKLKPPSMESLQKVRNLFDGGLPEGISKTEMPKANVGFMTASGSKLKPPSKESLQKVRNLFDEGMPEGMSNTEAPKANVGFMTASGSKLKGPSKRSLQQVRHLFDKDMPEGMSKTETPKANVGFMTASGSKLKPPSTESLRKVRSLFDDGVAESMSNTEIPKQNVGFMTASGSKLNPPNKSLQKARTLFNEDMSDGIGKLEVPRRNVAFTTASRSKLQPPSKESLQKLRNLFDEEMPESMSKTEMSTENGITTKVEDKVGEFGDVIIGNSETIWYSLDRPYDEGIFTQPTKNVAGDSKRKVHGSATQTLFKTPYKKNNDSKTCDNLERTEIFKPLAKRNKKENDLRNARVAYEEGPKESLNTLYDNLAGLKETSNNQTEVKRLARKIAKLEEKEHIKRKMKKEWKAVNGCNKTVGGSLLTEKLKSTKSKMKMCLQQLKEKYPFRIPSNLDKTYLASCCVQMQTIYFDNQSSNTHTFNGKTFRGNGEISSDLSEVKKICDMLKAVSLPVGKDGAVIICNDDDTIGISEITSSFMSCAGVDPKLMLPDPELWINNHYRWITWKLASLERRFPIPFGGRALTPNEVINQIRLRYDREIERSERSALKQIYEGDASPAQSLVLCVARIEQPQGDHGNIILELTDGWYSISCILAEDNPLRTYVSEKNKIVVGTKLITFGAEILNLSQPCSPLEAPSFESLTQEYKAYLDNMKNNARNHQEGINSLQEILTKYPQLKLHPNSTRRARWYTKMGFYHQGPTMPMLFSALLRNGGYVSEVRVEIVRQYPLVYKENSPFDIGHRTIRPMYINEKMYEKQSRLQNIDKQKVVEEIYLQVQKEFENEEIKSKQEKQSKNTSKRRSNRLSLSEKEIKILATGEEINDTLEEALDPTSIESIISIEQCQMLQEYKQGQKDIIESNMKVEVQKRITERLAEIGASAGSGGGDSETSSSLTGKYPNNQSSHDKCSFVSILRLRVVDIFNQGNKVKKLDTDDNHSKNICTGTVQIWRPTEEMQAHLKEGKMFRFFNLTANIIRDGEVQFRAIKATRFQEIISKDVDKLEVATTQTKSRYRRKLTHIDDIICGESFKPEFREVDMIGILIKVCTQVDYGEGVKDLGNREDHPRVRRNSNGNISPNKSSFQTVYLCDTSLNFVAIKFWKGVDEFGYQTLINDSDTKIVNTTKSPSGDTCLPNTLLYLRNLQWRLYSSQEFRSLSTKDETEGGSSIIMVPSLFVTEQTQITSNPSSQEISKVFNEIQTEIGRGVNARKFIAQAKMRLSKLLSNPIKQNISKQGTPQTPTNFAYPKTEDKNNRLSFTYNSSATFISPSNPKIEGHISRTLPSGKSNENIVRFRNPQQSPSTPTSSRKNERLRDIENVISRRDPSLRNCENFLAKGNVKLVAGSPAAMQSEKTRQKIRALENAAVKLSYWNP